MNFYKKKYNTSIIIFSLFVTFTYLYLFVPGPTLEQDFYSLQIFFGFFLNNNNRTRYYSTKKNNNSLLYKVFKLTKTNYIGWFIKNPSIQPLKKNNILDPALKKALKNPFSEKIYINQLNSDNKRTTYSYIKSFFNFFFKKSSGFLKRTFSNSTGNFISKIRTFFEQELKKKKKQSSEKAVVKKSKDITKVDVLEKKKLFPLTTSFFEMFKKKEDIKDAEIVQSEISSDEETLGAGPYGDPYRKVMLGPHSSFGEFFSFELSKTFQDAYFSDLAEKLGPTLTEWDYDVKHKELYGLVLFNFEDFFSYLYSCLQHSIERRLNVNFPELLTNDFIDELDVLFLEFQKSSVFLNSLYRCRVRDLDIRKAGNDYSKAAVAIATGFHSQNYDPLSLTYSMMTPLKKFLTSDFSESPFFSSFEFKTTFDAIHFSLKCIKADHNISFHKQFTKIYRGKSPEFGFYNGGKVGKIFSDVVESYVSNKLKNNSHTTDKKIAIESIINSVAAKSSGKKSQKKRNFLYKRPNKPIPHVTKEMGDLEGPALDTVVDFFDNLNQKLKQESASKVEKLPAQEELTSERKLEQITNSFWDKWDAERTKRREEAFLREEQSFLAWSDAKNAKLESENKEIDSGEEDVALAYISLQNDKKAEDEVKAQQLLLEEALFFQNDLKGYSDSEAVYEYDEFSEKFEQSLYDKIDYCSDYSEEFFENEEEDFFKPSIDLDFLEEMDRLRSEKFYFGPDKIRDADMSLLAFRKTLEPQDFSEFEFAAVEIYKKNSCTFSKPQNDVSEVFKHLMFYDDKFKKTFKKNYLLNLTLKESSNLKKFQHFELEGKLDCFLGENLYKNKYLNLFRVERSFLTPNRGTGFIKKVQIRWLASQIPIFNFKVNSRQFINQLEILSAGQQRINCLYKSKLLFFQEILYKSFLSKIKTSIGKLPFSSSKPELSCMNAPYFEAYKAVFYAKLHDDVVSPYLSKLLLIKVLDGFKFFANALNGTHMLHSLKSQIEQANLKYQEHVKELNRELLNKLIDFYRLNANESFLDAFKGRIYIDECQKKIELEQNQALLWDKLNLNQFELFITRAFNDWYEQFLAATNNNQRVVDNFEKFYESSSESLGFNDFSDQENLTLESGIEAFPEIDYFPSFLHDEPNYAYYHSLSGMDYKSGVIKIPVSKTQANIYHYGPTKIKTSGELDLYPFPKYEFTEDYFEYLFSGFYGAVPFNQLNSGFFNRFSEVCFDDPTKVVSAEEFASLCLKSPDQNYELPADSSLLRKVAHPHLVSPFEDYYTFGAFLDLYSVNSALRSDSFVIFGSLTLNIFFSLFLTLLQVYFVNIYDFFAKFLKK